MYKRQIRAFSQENRKTQIPWVKEVHQDLEECGIREEDVINREVLRRKAAEVKRFVRRETRDNNIGKMNTSVPEIKGMLEKEQRTSESERP